MATRLIALVILALSLLPVANLLPGGESDPDYGARMLDWGYGIAICVGIGTLAMYLARERRRGSDGRAGAPRLAAASAANFAAAMRRTASSRDRVFTAAAVVGAFVLYVIIALYVFSGRPLSIDEIVQVLQARWYAAGQLSIPVAPAREFFSVLHVVDLGEKVFGQFPAGGPAMLALGSLLNAEWLVGPAVGAACVALFGSLLPVFEPEASQRWRRGALILFAVAPFGAFMFGSHMNHATTLLWLLVAVLALSRATLRDDASPWWGLLVGIGLGIAATIRPVDAVAFALPAGAWLGWRARTGGRRLASLLLSGVGIAVPLTVLLYVNAQTTGAPLLFGYDLLWGSGHSLGFHQPPWGPPHTPSRGLELVSLYFTRLSTYLFESPFPAMLLVAGALWLTPRLRVMDRYLLIASFFVVVGYWAYWHDGFFLGPRFLFPLLPALILWTARFPSLLAVRLGSRSLGWAGARAALVTAVVFALINLAAVRIPTYRNGLTSMRFDIERESVRAGVRDALVLVKERWGSRLIVRMWALGVPRAETEKIYRHSDACKLELALTELERRGERGEAALVRLRPLLADSALVVRSTKSPDFTDGMLPGYEYPPACETQIALDWRGFSHLAPFLLAKDGNVYVRWLPGREAEIAGMYPGREVFLLSRTGSEADAGHVWERLRFAAPE